MVAPHGCWFLEQHWDIGDALIEAGLQPSIISVIEHYQLHNYSSNLVLF